MALVGVHITFGGSGSGVGSTPVLKTGGGTASQSMTTAAKSNVSAPTAGVLSIAASAPIYYAVGHNPDATVDPRRYYDPAFGAEDIFVNAGDFFAWEFVG